MSASMAGEWAEFRAASRVPGELPGLDEIAQAAFYAGAVAAMALLAAGIDRGALYRELHRYANGIGESRRVDA